MWSFSRRRIAFIAAVFSFGLLIFSYSCLQPEQPSMRTRVPMIRERSNVFSAMHRKLLHQHQATATTTTAKMEPNRIWGEKCSKADIVVTQGPTAPLPNGIPTYTVEIMNVCVSGCDISGIHLSCGWFSSARLINPKVFKRLSYNDCLVNDGKPLVNGGTLSFQYANTFHYPLSVSSVNC